MQRPRPPRDHTQRQQVAGQGDPWSARGVVATACRPGRVLLLEWQRGPPHTSRVTRRPPEDPSPSGTTLSVQGGRCCREAGRLPQASLSGAGTTAPWRPEQGHPHGARRHQPHRKPCRAGPGQRPLQGSLTTGADCPTPPASCRPLSGGRTACLTRATWRRKGPSWCHVQPVVSQLHCSGLR